MRKIYFAFFGLWASTLFTPAFSQNPASCKPSSVKKSMKYYEDAERANQSRESFVKIKELLLKEVVINIGKTLQILQIIRLRYYLTT